MDHHINISKPFLILIVRLYLLKVGSSSSVYVRSSRVSVLYLLLKGFTYNRIDHS